MEEKKVDKVVTRTCRTCTKQFSENSDRACVYHPERWARFSWSLMYNALTNKLLFDAAILAKLHSVGYHQVLTKMKCVATVALLNPYFPLHTYALTGTKGGDVVHNFYSCCGGAIDSPGCCWARHRTFDEPEDVSMRRPGMGVNPWVSCIASDNALSNNYFLYHRPIRCSVLWSAFICLYCLFIMSDIRKNFSIYQHHLVVNEHCKFQNYFHHTCTRI